MSHDPYHELSQNNVSAEGQLKVSQFVRLEQGDAKGIRILFVGNSITLHGARPEIGWFFDWGMAASDREKDYVHLVKQEILRLHPDAAFCICQGAEWEFHYQNGGERHALYEAARDFGADVIVMRLIENVPWRTFDGEAFDREYDALINYLNPHGTAKLVLTTSFWKHPGDENILAYAKKKGYPCIALGDLGEDDRMKAIGLFEHSGVSKHPGDLGMKAIADRISKVLREII